MKGFSKTFMIGAATAAHQAEGNNTNSDCWVLEQMKGSMYKEPSLDAVDHYNRYCEDIKYMADAGLNAYRFSIEWARVEPEKGKFASQEIEHYRNVLKCCHENNMTPVVTLHHFSSPKWLMAEGGWESESTIESFGNYTKYVVSELGDLIPYICTINEANMGIQISRITQDMMKQRSKTGDVQVGLNVDMTKIMEDHMKKIGAVFDTEPKNVQLFLAPRTPEGDLLIMKCHIKARVIIKKINPEIKVGLTLSLHDHQALPGGEEIVKEMQDEEFLHYLPYINDDDFFGLQNYTRKIYDANGSITLEESTKLTDMGYEFYPEALAGTIRFVSEYWKKPILVTENGVATENDKDRVEFIQRAVSGLYECVQDGINVIGYLHWSLLDNFEWQLGFQKKFGLISVDRSTQTRMPKESLSYLGNIRRQGL